MDCCHYIVFITSDSASGNKTPTRDGESNIIDALSPVSNLKDILLGDGTYHFKKKNGKGMIFILLKKDISAWVWKCCLDPIAPDISLGSVGIEE